MASAPAHLIECALPTGAMIAHVLVSQHADHVPLDRQAQALDLHRATLGLLGRQGRVFGRWSTVWRST